MARRASILAGLALVLTLAGAGAASAAPAVPVGVAGRCAAAADGCRPSLRLLQGIRRAAARQRLHRGLAAAGAPAAPLPCDPGVVPVPGALCGTVEVPRDRSAPDGATFAVAYELYLHTGSGAAVSAIMANPGGPGQATTDLRFFYLYAFEPLLVDHDLLLVDDRGRGRSGAVDCPDVQHATSDWFGNLRRCADSLAAAGTLDDYATGDVADDAEAVRAALGYDKIDYYGVSSGAVDVEAYALRYPQHLRSIVLDSPWTSQNYTVDTNTMMRDPLLDRIRLICRRSVACRRSLADPVAPIAWLARRLAAAPLRGTGRDADGVEHAIVLDEAGLIARLLADDSAGFLNQGELAAATVAYEHGDRAPLLRLAAEMDYGWPADAGDAASFSVGDAFAVMCSEQDWQWDRAAAVPERRAQYAAYVRATPTRAIAPFSRAGYFEAQRELYSSGDTCIEWPATHANLPVPAAATYPHVPTLVLTSDLDLIRPVSERTVAPRWPDGRLVVVHGIGHATLGWNDCTLGTVRRFMAALDAGDTSCADTPATAWWAVGRFPERVADARRARRALGDRSRGGDRRAATVAVATVVDAVKRTLRSSGEAPVPGLRGGASTATWSDEGTLALDLDGARFARDLAVTGAATWGADGALAADVVVRGAASGSLHLEGAVLGAPAAATFRVTGMLAGRRLVVVVAGS